jgi:hypothetical protein
MRKVKSKKRAVGLKKPIPSTNDVLASTRSDDKAKDLNKNKSKKTTRRAPEVARSGPVPVGDVRLTVNIRKDLHLKLKIRAAKRRTTIGELIEGWVSSWGKKRV